MHVSFSPRTFLVLFLAVCGVMFVTVSQIREEVVVQEIKTAGFWAECGNGESVWMEGEVRRAPSDGANIECVEGGSLFCKNQVPSYFKLINGEQSGTVKINSETEILSLPLGVGEEVLILGSCLKQEERKVILAERIVRASEEGERRKPLDAVFYTGALMIVLATFLHLNKKR